MISFAASDARSLRSNILLVVVSASTTTAVSLEPSGETPKVFAMFESSRGVPIFEPDCVTVDDF